VSEPTGASSRAPDFGSVTLSNFALAARIDLLVERYGAGVQVTPQVLDELLEGIAVGFDALTTVIDAVTRGELGSAGDLAPEERRLLGELLRNLGHGEASVLACAQHREGTVVTDDRAARSICGERGVPFTGTIGILLASVRDGLLTPPEADVLLDRMVQAGFFSPVRRVSDLL